mmetsp:Transcript_899/g.2272  ORF Transcript_899/g.2272 Transcript_899/m.2272 type:complete len:232 (-) Transcript_899:216-911(-)
MVMPRASAAAIVFCMASCGPIRPAGSFFNMPRTTSAMSGCSLWKRRKRSLFSMSECCRTYARMAMRTFASASSGCSPGKAMSKSILEKTRPSCQTLFATLFGRPSSISGASRPIMPRCHDGAVWGDTSPAALRSTEAPRRSGNMAWVSPSKTMMEVSESVPWATPSRSIASAARSRSTIKGSALLSGTSTSSFGCDTARLSPHSVRKLRVPVLSKSRKLSWASVLSMTLGA